MTAVDVRPHYRTAEQELADALEGTAPALTRIVVDKLGNPRAVELAKAIKRATDLAVRRHAFEHLEQALLIVEQALEDIPAECEAAEQPPCSCQVTEHERIWDRNCRRHTRA